MRYIQQQMNILGEATGNVDQIDSLLRLRKQVESLETEQKRK